MISGGTPKREISEYWGGDIDWVTPKDLSSLNSIFINTAPEKITHLGLRKSSATLLPTNSVLFSSRAPIGHLAITTKEMATNQGFKSLVPLKNVNSKYLYYCIKYFKPAIEALGNGATFKEVSKKVVENFEIPLPPLPIQKQIAAVLEKADTLRSQCLQMEQELNSLAQSVFLDMFGDPVQNEKNWKICKLKDLVTDLQGGKSIAASEDEENSGKNRVLKISAVTWGEFKPTESKPLPNTYEPPKEHFVRPNDLLFSRANTTELVGATSLVFEAPDNVLLPDKLWRFIWKDKAAQSQVFMWQLLSNQSVRGELGKISTGSGGSMKNISKAKLYDFEIIYPDKQLQLEFELKFIKIREQLSSNIELQEHLSVNFNSLMQRAFKGELDLKDVA